MGLDGVELLMRVESLFELSISDAEAGLMDTPGSVHRYVCEQLRNRRPRCPTLRIFQVARQLLMEAGWARWEVTLDSPIVGRQFPWKALESRVGRSLLRPPTTSWWSWLGWAEEKYTLRQVLRACAPNDWHWTPERAWTAIALAVSETLGVPVELVCPEADFYADLGMS